MNHRPCRTILGKPALTAGTQNRLDGVQRTHLPQIRGVTPRQRLPLRLRSAERQTTYHGYRRDDCPRLTRKDYVLYCFEEIIEAIQDTHYNEMKVS